MNDLPEKAADFFRKEKGFNRLMKEFIKKYRHLGRIGGTVKLNDMNREEEAALSGIMGQDYSGQGDVVISLEEFQEALNKTRFADVDLKDLLFAYSGDSLLTKKQEEELYKKKKEQFFIQLEKKHPGMYSRVVIEHFKNKKTGSRRFHQIYDKDSSYLKNCLDNILKAVEELPEKYERLPVFANRIAGNPHAFDLDTDSGRMLLLALQIILSYRDNSYKIISTPTAEEASEVLGSFNIIRDDILNFVTCTGLLALNKGKVVPLWKEAIKGRNVLNAPLREIIKVESFIPAFTYNHHSNNLYDSIDSFRETNKNEKVVFIIENSGVFSEILDYFTEDFFPPLICSHGQFKLAALMLMDKLVESGATLYYSGDFDPEGLQMAQRLLKRYPDFLKLWHYTVEDYESCLSEVPLTQTKLNKLAGITAAPLVTLKERILLKRRAGYQEKLVQVLARDIKETYFY